MITSSAGGVWPAEESYTSNRVLIVSCVLDVEQNLVEQNLPDDVKRLLEYGRARRARLDDQIVKRWLER